MRRYGQIYRHFWEMWLLTSVLIRGNAANIRSRSPNQHHHHHRHHIRLTKSRQGQPGRGSTPIKGIKRIASLLFDDCINADCLADERRWISLQRTWKFPIVSAKFLSRQKSVAPCKWISRVVSTMTKSYTDGGRENFAFRSRVAIRRGAATGVYRRFAKLVDKLCILHQPSFDRSPISWLIELQRLGSP